MTSCDRVPYMALFMTSSREFNPPETPKGYAASRVSSRPETHLSRPGGIRSDPSRLGDRVAIDIGTRIIRGELAPGSRLPTETELCLLHGVSRTVVRDAIRTLSAGGLVDVRHGHGTLVAPPSDSPFTGAFILYLMRTDLTLDDLREARALVEPTLASLAAERSAPEDWDAMRQELDRYAAAVEAHDWDTARNAHFHFHASLLDSVRVPALRILLRPVLQVVLLTAAEPVDGRSTDPPSVWTDEDVQVHYPILDALEQRDPALSAQRLREHIRPTRRSGALVRDFPPAQELLVEILSFRDIPLEGGGSSAD
jgi:GntR family transcriptional regulator, transcriptional repressor for pyruvate dehydrogenase complex